MDTLKKKVMQRISKLADKAIADDPFGDDVDKADVVTPFSDGIENGTLTPDELLSLPDKELLRRLAGMVAVEAFAYGGSLLTPKQLDMIEESALGKVRRRKTMVVQEVMEAVKTLSPNDQQHLRKLLDEMLVQPEEETKLETFHQALFVSGLVKTFKTPPATNATKRRLIEVKGKPVSETIIEERR